MPSNGVNKTLVYFLKVIDSNRDLPTVASNHSVRHVRVKIRIETVQSGERPFLSKVQMITKLFLPTDLPPLVGKPPTSCSCYFQFRYRRRKGKALNRLQRVQNLASVIFDVDIHFTAPSAYQSINYESFTGYRFRPDSHTKCSQIQLRCCA